MKILFVITTFVSADCICKVMVDTREDCQAMCDLSRYCEAWTFSKESKFCGFKKRSGWTVKPDNRYESGFKNQGPWFEPNTDFSGGSYICE